MSGTPTQHHVAEWFRRWHSPIRKFLAGRGALRIAEVDDIAQEVFLRLLRYTDAEVVENPQAYVFKMASNVAAEWAIRPQQRFKHEPIWLESLVSEDQSDQDLDNQSAQREMLRALESLTARERAILKLHYELGMTQAEIALRLGLTLRVVRRDFEKSYGKLRQQLGETGHGRK